MIRNICELTETATKCWKKKKKKEKEGRKISKQGERIRSALPAKINEAGRAWPE